MLKDKIFKLIVNTSTILPKDVVEAIKKALINENKTLPQNILKAILENIELAKKKQYPICQDTGTPIFNINYPNYFSQKEIKESIIEATKKASIKYYLRPNAVNPLSDINSGNNIGIGFPVYFFNEWDKDILQIKLMLKGGGSENCGIQYSLPNASLKANRDIDGIKKVIIDSCVKAQGKGCAPGILGVGIGGDRVSSYILSKHQLFRHLNDINENKMLATLEKELLDKSNMLGIGPMGLGGKTTLLGIKIGTNHRIPASFFVSISYMCWACRRKTLIVKTDENKNFGDYHIED